MDRGSLGMRVPRGSDEDIVEMRYVADRHRLTENPMTQVLDELLDLYGLYPPAQRLRRLE